MSPLPAKAFSDWEDLLDFIEDRRVIPILGPDILPIETEDQGTTFDQYLALQLAHRLGFSMAPNPDPPSLDAVVSRYVSSGRGARQDLYPRIKAIVREAPFAPPKPLQQLAEIAHFDLFVSTTCDPLLETALNNVRYGGQPITDVFVYKSKGGQDLSRPKEDLQKTTLYHLFGRVSTVPTDYVICEEDMLEFIYSLQQEKFRPPLLFDAFRENHLLLIGVSFSDWLARFFLRLAKPGRLSESRDVLEIVADQRMQGDNSLVLFLQHFSSRTQIFSGDAVAFVEELWQRWHARNPTMAIRPAKPKIPPAEAMPAGAIFISYAREDLDTVQELKAELDAEGLTVWFDRDRLGAGDAWDTKIKRNIQACSLFIAVISRHTEQREEGYFRREWYYAVNRSLYMAEDKPFIIPVIVDDTVAPRRIPERFKDTHIVNLRGGQTTPEFVRKLRALIVPR